MKKIILRFSMCLIFGSVQATIVRNGVDVPQEKIDKIWPILQKMNRTDFYWLWRYSKADKKDYHEVKPIKKTITNQVSLPVLMRKDDILFRKD